MIRVSGDELKIIMGVISEHASDCDVLAFGSRCPGSSGVLKKYSDLDLVFSGKQRLGLKRLFKIEDAFAESDLPYRVDVLDYNSVSPEFRAIIDSRNETVYRGKKS